MTDDRYERHNLIGDPSRQPEIESFRQQLLALMGAPATRWPRRLLTGTSQRSLRPPSRN